jgi:hypothetical protein
MRSDHERLVNAGPDGVIAKTKSGSVKWTAHKAGWGGISGLGGTEVFGS